MAIRLKMAKVQTILTLRSCGWSFGRIARELGLQEAPGNSLSRAKFLELALRCER